MIKKINFSFVFATIFTFCVLPSESASSIQMPSFSKQASPINAPAIPLDARTAGDKPLARITADRLGTYAGGGLGVYGKPEMWRKDIDLARSLHFGVVRFNSDTWTLLEPKRGEFNWGPLDDIVGLFTKTGVDVLFTLPISSRWNSSADKLSVMGHKISPTHIPTKDLAGFEEFVRAVAMRYKGRIKYYEVWNEPDFEMYWKGSPNAEEYLPFLKTAYRVIKEVDPNAFVMMGGLAKPKSGEWFERFLSLGGGDYTDAVNLHIYPAFSTLAQAIDVNSRLLKKFGLVKPFWITETSTTGAYFETRDREKEEYEKAVYLVQTYTRAFSHPDVDRIFWHTLRNPGRDVRMKKDYDFGLMTLEGSPLPAYKSYRVWTEVLLDSQPLGSKEVGPFEAYAFKKSQSTIYVLWKTEGKAPLVLPANAKSARLITYQGESQTVTEQDASSVQVGPEPIYLEIKQ